MIKVLQNGGWILLLLVIQHVRRNPILYSNMTDNLNGDLTRTKSVPQHKLSVMSEYK